MTASSKSDWEAPLAVSTGSGAPQPALPGLVDPRAILGFLRRKAALIATFTMLAFAGLAAAYMALPSRYTATALVLVDPRNQKVLLTEDVIPGIGGDTAALESYVAVAATDDFLKPIARDLGVFADPEFARPGLLGRTPGETDIMAAFRKRLWVERRGLTYLVSVNFSSADPDKAARVANAAAGAFVDRLVEPRREATDDAAGWLERRIESLRAAVVASEQAVAEYRTANRIVDAGQNVTVDDRRLTDLSQQIALAKANAEQARARFDQMRRERPTDLDASANQTGLLATLRSQYAAERQQAAQLQRVYGDRHPRLSQASARLAALEQQIAQEIERRTADARAAFEAADAQYKALEAELTRAETRATGTVEASVRLRDLEREAAANRALYEQMLTRFKETTAQRGLQPTDTRVVSVASPPTRSSRPSPIIAAPAGLVASLLFGLVGAIAVDALRRGVRSAEEVEDLTGAPVVAEIPAKGVGGRPIAVKPGTDLRRPLRRVGDVIRKVAAMRPGSHVLVCGLGDAAAAEAVAMALARLADEARLTAVVVLPDPPGGATRRKRPQRDPGLYDVLSGAAPLDRAVRFEEPTAGVQMVNAGCPAGMGLSDLVRHPEFGRLSGFGRKRYDILFVVAPDVDDDLDGDLFGAQVLVCGWNVTRPGRLQAAAAHLKPTGGQPVMAILHGVP
ncbi:GumC family protein [Chthonobacter rhizosphaerae]|uniref:GumC family protein n=1 Tax=Chthonobacter rhizosphaerae TaxID=2735553 RepID=UPI0015EF3190|nr:GumC family protein [Chthonobacter rhizosphaerae]